jgi:hypothetical protein
MHSFGSRRLTPSPTETSENSSFLVSLRPRDLQDQILDTLRSNDLPLINPLGNLVDQSVSTDSELPLDFKFIQRLIFENSRIKLDLINLSLACYTSRQTNSFRGAETLLNFLLSKLNEKELLALKNLLAQDIVDDNFLSQIINLIRLTGISDPLKLISILENSLQGTLNLRKFMGSLETSTHESLIKLETYASREVPSEIINAINEKENQGLSNITNRINTIETEHLQEVTNIQRSLNIQRILIDTGVAVGVSSLVWASYRIGVWEYVVSGLNANAPSGVQQTDSSILNNIQLGLAGLTGFFFKKGLHNFIRR